MYTHICTLLFLFQSLFTASVPCRNTSTITLLYWNCPHSLSVNISLRLWAACRAPTLQFPCFHFRIYFTHLLNTTNSSWSLAFFKLSNNCEGASQENISSCFIYYSCTAAHTPMIFWGTGASPLIIRQTSPYKKHYYRLSSAPEQLNQNVGRKKKGGGGFCVGKTSLSVVCCSVSETCLCFSH